MTRWTDPTSPWPIRCTGLKSANVSCLPASAADAFAFALPADAAEFTTAINAFHSLSHSPIRCGFGPFKLPSKPSHGNLSAASLFVAVAIFEAAFLEYSSCSLSAVSVLSKDATVLSVPSSSYTVTSTCTPAKNLTLPSSSLTGANVNMFQNGRPFFV